MRKLIEIYIILDNIDTKKEFNELFKKNKDELYWLNDDIYKAWRDDEISENVSENICLLKSDIELLLYDDIRDRSIDVLDVIKSTIEFTELLDKKGENNNEKTRIKAYD